MSRSKKIRLYLIDDHLMVLEGLKSLFADVEDINICGSSTSAEAAESEVAKSKPHVMLMDIRLPGISGIEACRKFKEIYPGIKIIMLTSFLESRMVTDALEAGADGYLLKQIDSEQLYSSVRQVTQGEIALTPSATRELVTSIKGNDEHEKSDHPFAQLSARDIRIAHAVSLGKINKEIADELGLNEKTVKNLLTVIFTRLGINRRAQLAVLYEKYAKAAED